MLTIKHYTSTSCCYTVLRLILHHVLMLQSTKLINKYNTVIIVIIWSSQCDLKPWTLDEIQSEVETSDHLLLFSISILSVWYIIFVPTNSSNFTARIGFLLWVLPHLRRQVSLKIIPQKCQKCWTTTVQGKRFGLNKRGCGQRHFLISMLNPTG